MKTKLLLASVLTVVTLTLGCTVAVAGDAVSTAKFVDSIKVAPNAVLKTAGLNGESTFGAGLDLGANVNKSVGLHITAVTFETGDWRNSSVDESEAYCSADLTKFSTETFVPYFKGGGVADWNDCDFGLTVGGGARLQFNKRVALFGDYTLRAWLTEGRGKDGVARVGLDIAVWKK